jgi:uncharacterized protein YceH (UPF0502 family)
MGRNKKQPIVEHVVRRGSRKQQSYNHKVITHVDKEKTARLIGTMEKSARKVGQALVSLQLKVEDLKKHLDKIK